jgi:hypothetical protein
MPNKRRARILASAASQVEKEPLDELLASREKTKINGFGSMRHACPTSVTINCDAERRLLHCLVGQSTTGSRAQEVAPRHNAREDGPTECTADDNHDEETEAMKRR